MTLVLVQNEGLPKEISENMVHLPKKKNISFLGSCSTLLAKPVCIF